MKRTNLKNAANSGFLLLNFTLFYSGTTLFTKLFESSLYLNLFCENRRIVPGVKIRLPGAQYLLTTTEKSVQFVKDIFCMRNYKKKHFPFESKN